MDKAYEKLKEIKNDVISCKKCSLFKTRILPVIGKGNHQATIMLVGEAPGSNEDKTGIPFCGQSGDILTELFKFNWSSKRKMYIYAIILKMSSS